MTMSRTSTVTARMNALRPKFVSGRAEAIVIAVATVEVPVDVGVEVVAVRAVLVRAAAVETAAAGKSNQHE